MTYFKLDIPKVNEQISLYKHYKKCCEDDIGLVYGSLGYTESAWNDQNSHVFAENIKKDKYKINEYFNYLDSLYEEISKFNNNIDDICHKYGNRTNSIVFKYDDLEISECKRKLNNIISYLDDSLNNININSFPNGFTHLYLVYELRDEIKNIKSLVNNLINNISSFISSIDNELYNSSYRLKRIVKNELNIIIPKYTWNIKTIDERKIGVVEQVTNYTSSNSNIKIDVEKDKINSIKESFNIYNRISELSNNDIEGLSNNKKDYNASRNDIGYETENKDLNLIYNTQNYIADKKNINSNYSSKINGLKDNVVDYNTLENNIEYQAENRDLNLDNNLESYKSSTNSMDTMNQKSISGLNENIDQVKINSNNMKSFSDTTSSNLKSEINQYKANSNSINYVSNDTVDISIPKMEVNASTARISDIERVNYDLKNDINKYEINNSSINIHNN